MSNYIKRLLEELGDEINSTKSMQEDDLLDYIELKNKEKERENKNDKTKN